MGYTTPIWYWGTAQATVSPRVGGCSLSSRYQRRQFAQVRRNGSSSFRGHHLRPLSWRHGTLPLPSPEFSIVFRAQVPAPDYGVLHEAMVAMAPSLKLDPTDTLIRKATQLFETVMVRHPFVGGKTDSQINENSGATRPDGRRASNVNENLHHTSSR